MLVHHCILWALPSSISALAIFDNLASPLEKRQITVSSQNPSPGSAGVTTVVTTIVNSTDGIDLNSSWLDDLPMSEGGDSPLTSEQLTGNTTFQTTSSTLVNGFETSKKVKRTTLIPGGGRSLTFDVDDDHFNFTFSRCALTWGRKLGRWTFFTHNTHDNVTMLDIYRDVCDQAKLPYNNGRQLSNPKYSEFFSSILDINMRAAVSEATDSLDEIVGNYSVAHPTPSQPYDHTELRKLLELPGNHWFVIGGTAVLGGLVTAGINWSAAGANDTAWQICAGGVNTFLIITIGGALQAYGQNRHAQEIDRKIAAAAVSGGRAAVHTIREAGTQLVDSIHRGSGNALNTLVSSTTNLLQIGGSVSGNDIATGSNRAPAYLNQVGGNTATLQSVVIDQGLEALRETSIQGAQIATFQSIEASFTTNQGGCN